MNFTEYKFLSRGWRIHIFSFILGWYELNRRKETYECRYNENKGYVIFSAMGMKENYGIWIIQMCE